MTGNIMIMALSGLAAQKPGFAFSLMAEGEPFSQRLGIQQLVRSCWVKNISKSKLIINQSGIKHLLVL